MGSSQQVLLVVFVLLSGFLSAVAANQVCHGAMFQEGTAETEQESLLLPTNEGLYLDPQQLVPSAWWSTLSDRSSYTNSIVYYLKMRLEYLRAYTELTSAAQTKKKKKRRKRRSTSTPAVSHCQQSKVQNFTKCYPKNHNTTDNTLRICSFCVSRTRLAADCSPMYINEVVCGSEGPQQSSQTAPTCLANEGVCRQVSVRMKVKRSNPGTGDTEEEIELGVSCECQLYKSSVLVALNET